jgi:hypothetical protein
MSGVVIIPARGEARAALRVRSLTLRSHADFEQWLAVVTAAAGAAWPDGKPARRVPAAKRARRAAVLLQRQPEAVPFDFRKADPVQARLVAFLMGARQ